MGHVELTDAEVAVVIDLLDAERRALRRHRTRTGPRNIGGNVEGALAKMTSLMSPEQSGVIVATDRLAPFADQEVISIAVGLENDESNWRKGEHRRIARALAKEADAEAQRRGVAT